MNSSTPCSSKLWKEKTKSLEIVTNFLVDNSFLHWYRSQNSSKKSIDLLEQLFEEFNLKLENIFFTDRSFLEVIGKGKVSKEIGLPALINPEGKKIQDDLHKNHVVSRERIEAFINFLEEDLFKKFKEVLPQTSISLIASKNLQQYPFIEKLKHLEEILISYAKNIDEKNEAYESFIKVLVEDSITRVVLNVVNLRDISPEKDRQALKCIGDIIYILIMKYGYSEAFESNLILIMSGLKKHAEAVINRQVAGKPL